MPSYYTQVFAINVYSGHLSLLLFYKHYYYQLGDGSRGGDAYEEQGGRRDQIQLIQLRLLHDGGDQRLERVLDHDDVQLGIPIRAQLGALGERHLHGGHAQGRLRVQTAAGRHQDVDAVVGQDGKRFHEPHHRRQHIPQEFALGRGGQQRQRRLDHIQAEFRDAQTLGYRIVEHQVRGQLDGEDLLVHLGDVEELVHEVNANVH